MDHISVLLCDVLGRTAHEGKVPCFIVLHIVIITGCVFIGSPRSIIRTNSLLFFGKENIEYFPSILTRLKMVVSF